MLCLLFCSKTDQGVLFLKTRIFITVFLSLLFFALENNNWDGNSQKGAQTGNDIKNICHLNKIQ